MTWDMRINTKQTFEKLFRNTYMDVFLITAKNKKNNKSYFVECIIDENTFKI